jgi:hypothetical protein
MMVANQFQGSDCCIIRGSRPPVTQEAFCLLRALSELQMEIGAVTRQIHYITD